MFENLQKLAKIYKNHKETFKNCIETYKNCMETVENIGKYSKVFHPPCAFD
jgi:hypothetical protein